MADYRWMHVKQRDLRVFDEVRLGGEVMMVDRVFYNGSELTIHLRQTRLGGGEVIVKTHYDSPRLWWVKRPAMTRVVQAVMAALDSPHHLNTFEAFKREKQLSVMAKALQSQGLDPDEKVEDWG